VERIRAGRMRDAGINAGLITEEDLDEMVKSWEEWEEREDASLGMMHGDYHPEIIAYKAKIGYTLWTLIKPFSTPGNHPIG
jgi:hypothetical protein